MCGLEWFRCGQAILLVVLVVRMTQNYWYYFNLGNKDNALGMPHRRPT
jgi:hypothetical protein